MAKGKVTRRQKDVARLVRERRTQAIAKLKADKKRSGK